MRFRDWVKAKPLPCSLDPELGVMIHRFDGGQCACRCGEVVVRMPVKKQRVLYGRMLRGGCKAPSKTR